jgi:hypothetical protein
MKSNDGVGFWAVAANTPTGAFTIHQAGVGNRVTVTTAGNVGIGTETPAYLLDVAGTIRGTNVAPSDARLKTNVRTIEHALDDLERLRGVRFDWKKDGAHSIGVIAQEVEKVYPELVSTADYKAVDYAKLTAVLIEAVKELRHQNETLEVRLSRLEASRVSHASR